MDAKKIRYFYLLNSFLILLFMGTSFAWSIFATSLESYFGWTRANTSLAFTLNTVFFTVGNICGGMLSNKLSYKNIVRVAACLIAGGFLLTTRINSLWQLYFTYSMLCGGGVGIGYNAIVSALPLWFPEKSGFTTGILLTGYAFSTSILGPFSQWIINGYGWKTAFSVLALIVFVVMLAGSLNLRTPSSEEALQFPVMKRTINQAEKDYTTDEMLKTSAFWLYFFARIVSTGIGLTIFNHLVPAIREFFPSEKVLAIAALSLVSLCNGLGRLIWGFFYDRFGVSWTVRLIAFVYLFGMAILVLAMNVKMPLLFVLAGCILVFCFGGNAGTLPAVSRGLFGSKHFSMNYSLINSSALISSFIPTIIGTLQTQNGTYRQAIYVLLIMAVGGCFVSAAVKDGAKQKAASTL